MVVVLNRRCRRRRGRSEGAALWSRRKRLPRGRQTVSSFHGQEPRGAARATACGTTGAARDPPLYWTPQSTHRALQGTTWASTTAALPLDVGGALLVGTHVRLWATSEFGVRCRMKKDLTAS